MANMIPAKPRDFTPASMEGVMFDALASLPDDYYVFHSFKIVSVNDNTLYESETDFVIFHPDLGVLCLEAKAGAVRYENGEWMYQSGIIMHNGGPFHQASANKWKLMHYIERSNLAPILKHCKFIHGVWFPAVSDAAVRSMTLPSEADRSLIMAKEALSDPEPYLRRMFSIELPNGKETTLTDLEKRRLIREVLCPRFNVFPAASLDSDLKKMVFHRMLNEQKGILDFLTEQRSAVINGAAGTGKTMIALEKAQRHAADGEKVLFLCYNKKLQEHLAETHPSDNISYFTIDGFACSICNTPSPDYGKCKLKLEDMYLLGTFPYTHVIIDEGQDFGREDIFDGEIIQLMHDIVLEQENGTFYVFYDRLQLIQAEYLPNYITEAECKLTLHRNCRNTENIATTSMKPLTDKKPKLMENAIKGIPANIRFCQTGESIIAQLDRAIDSLTSDGIKDIVILTCKTEQNSALSSKIKDGRYRNKYMFTTCRKFKGLEADAIVLIDVDCKTFEESNVLLFYVGTSRARLRLDIITTLSDDECKQVLKETLAYSRTIKKAKKELAGCLNALCVLDLPSA